MNRARSLLASIAGLALCGLGALGVLIQTDVIGWQWLTDVRDWWFDINWTRPLLGLLAVGALLLALVFVRLVFGSVRRPGRRDAIQFDSVDGRTRVQSAAIGRALCRDLESLPGVRWASVDKIENGTATALGLRVGGDIDTRPLAATGAAAVSRAAESMGRILARNDIQVTARMIVCEPKLSKRSVK
jgi:hypothetical protein